METSFAALRTFEDHLHKERSGYLAGGSLSYADLALFLQLWELLEDDQFPGAFSPPHEHRFPSLKARV